MSEKTNKWLVGTLVIFVLFLGGQSLFTYKLYQRINNENKEVDLLSKQQLNRDENTSSLDKTPWVPFNKNHSKFNFYNPLEEMQRMHDEMNQIFGQSFSRLSQDPNFDQFFGDSTFEPRIDIKDEGEHYLITADIPGAEESTITVTIEKGQLRVSGSTEHGKKEENKSGSIVHRERFFGSFERNLPIPEDVDEAMIKQDYKDGVLTLTLPKKKQAELIS